MTRQVVIRRPRWLRDEFKRWPTWLVDNHRSVGGAAFFRLLPRTILYVFGVFTESFYGKHGVFRDHSRRVIALTGSESVVLGVVSVFCPADLDALWKAQPVEYYGYIVTLDVLPQEAVVENARRLDEWIEFLEPSQNVSSAEVVRAIEDDDHSYLMVLHANPEVPIDISGWSDPSCESTT